MFFYSLQYNELDINIGTKWWGILSLVFRIAVEIVIIYSMYSLMMLDIEKSCIICLLYKEKSWKIVYVCIYSLLSFP